MNIFWEEGFVEKLDKMANFPETHYLYKIPECLYSTLTANLMRKKSAFLQVVDETFMQIFESGIQNRLSDIYISNLLPAKPPESISLSFKQLQTVFFILLAGHCISSMVFFVEKVVYYYLRRKYKPKNNQNKVIA